MHDIDYVRFCIALVVDIVLVCFLRSVALAVPKPGRMRRPWTLWLLLLPLVSNFLVFFVLLPLTESYRRYFQEHKSSSHGGCGYGTVIVLGVLSPLGLLRKIPTPTAAFHQAWPHLAGGIVYMRAAGRWAEFIASIGFIAFLIIAWDLRRSARNYELNKNVAKSSQEALAWLESH